ncbi:MAG TPA: hypothetical protein VKA65_14965 [Acidimicrobiales bacterium]|nr:hypothetical protein [Acidimicrobiales bacterium]
MTGLYALASAGLACLSFFAGRRFRVAPRHTDVPGGARGLRGPRDEQAAELAVPRLTGPVAASSAGVSADAFADLDRRVTALERAVRRRSRSPERPAATPLAGEAAVVGVSAEPPLDKPATLSHYEALADQVARERRLADVEPRGRVMRFPSRPLTAAREHQDR